MIIIIMVGSPVLVLMVVVLVVVIWQKKREIHRSLWRTFCRGCVRNNGFISVENGWMLYDSRDGDRGSVLVEVIL